MADPVSIGTAISTVAAWFNIGFSGRSLSRADRRALRASGTRPIRGVFRTPDGSILSREQAIAAGYAVLAAQAPGAPAPTPAPTPLPRPPVTGGELFEDLLRRPHTPAERGLPRGVPEWEELLRRPSQNIPDRNPSELERLLRRPLENRVLGAVARVGGFIAGVLYPGTLGDSDLGLELPETRDRRGARNPRRPRPATDSRGQSPPRVPPVLPTSTGQTPADLLPQSGRPTPRPGTRPGIRPPWPLPLPGGRALPERRPGPVPTGEPTAGTVPANPVLTSPAPAPRPRPAPRPVASPRPSSPLDLLPLLFTPTAPGVSARPSLPQPRPATNPLSDPSTRPDSLRLSAPLTAFQPRPLPFGTPSSSDPCQCQRTRTPRKKRKPRNECWRGTYTETRSGLIKARKEKIRCQ